MSNPSSASSLTIAPIQASMPKYRGVLGYNRWTLCLGAGVSFGVVPKWNELALVVINKVFGLTYSIAKFNEITSSYGWGLDSWIQAAANHFQFKGHSMAEFHTLLEDAIYEDLRKRASVAGIQDDLFEALRWPRNIKKGKVNKVCEFFEAEYGGTTLLGLVRWAVDATKKNKLPFAIITFNAETLFHTVFELFQRRDHYRLKIPNHSHPRYRFTRIGNPRPICRDVDSGDPKVPIYHCHGTLVPRLPHHPVRPDFSTNNLVFLEQEYLNVATREATWPETLFMYHAKLSQMVFVGVSMSDANMRRWLGLTEEFAQQRRPTDCKRRIHYWITKKPESALEPVLTEGLAHLGVRPAWLDDWSDLESGIRNMTAV